MRCYPIITMIKIYNKSYFNNKTVKSKKLYEVENGYCMV